MNKCPTYNYILVFIILGYVECGDNLINTHENVGDEISDEEEANFEVTEAS